MKKYYLFIIFLVVVSFFLGLTINYSNVSIADNLSFDEEEATIRAIKKVSPAVVSINVSGDAKKISADSKIGITISNNNNSLLSVGTGFIISEDGYIITNKHVVNFENENLSFRITLASGKKYYAQLIGTDPLNDLALLKIYDNKLPYVELGNSDQLQPGSSVVAIGNSLGLYQNSVTKGIVSGLNRQITASDESGYVENLGNVIQTDAQINLGNSGGPLINLAGKVIGVNVAVDNSGRSIGFAIPINDVKPVIKSAKEVGRIMRSRLGVRYLVLDEELAQKNNLKINNGALIQSNDEKSAITKDSPAEKAGLAVGDIITEINSIKLSKEKSLLSIVQQYRPGQKIGLKILRGDKTIIKIVELDEFK